jgi:molybdenum cofactor cytidylyltransferase
MQPVVLVLASGRGERFLASGGTTHKLRALLHGKPVLAHTLDAVRASGLPFHLEDAGHPGMGDSIAAAVRAAPSDTGWLILPGDLPMVQPETLRLVALALAGGQARVVVPVMDEQRGHPVGFSATYRDALLALQGDQGAAAVLRAAAAQGQLLRLQVSDRGCVGDIDTLQDLQRLQGQAPLRNG